MESPETIDLDLTEGEERQVGRRAATRVCPSAMVDDGAQRCDKIGGQPFDMGTGHLLLAEDPVGPQFAVAYLRQHFQRMCSAPARGVPGPGSLRSKCEELGAARDLIELAEIVEEQLRSFAVCEVGARARIPATISQQAVGQTAIRHLSNLLFDGLQRRLCPGARCQLEAQRKQRCEPADRARQIKIVADMLAAMAFQLNQE